MFDLLGTGYTLLSTDAGGDRIDTEPWRRDADRRGLPLTIVDPRRHGFAAIAGDAAVLVRPDQHIAWIGPVSADPVPVLDDAVTGVLPTVP
ncbi:hypothetical protein [Tersicoccus sp. Bi-70]|uniref:aromatic-ring hydroxylase C-terminal domain-containing protein n=1 Tax=Tersicoccus sp. Bi-70 TaxID=1897634 RepID=UPI00350EF7C4